MVLEAEGVMVGAEDLVGVVGREKYGAGEGSGEGNVLREMWEERRYRRAMEVYWWSKLLPEHMPGGVGGVEGAVGISSAWSQRGRGGVGMTVGKVEFARVCAMLLKEERKM